MPQKYRECIAINGRSQTINGHIQTIMYQAAGCREKDINDKTIGYLNREFYYNFSGKLCLNGHFW